MVNVGHRRDDDPQIGDNHSDLPSDAGSHFRDNHRSHPFDHGLQFPANPTVNLSTMTRPCLPVARISMAIVSIMVPLVEAIPMSTQGRRFTV
jgi:hypothetical protein